MSCDSSGYRFPDAVKDPGESLKVELDLYDMCAVRFKSNEPYDSGNFVRPNVPNGFAYEVTTAGVSGPSEPRWPTTIAATIVSGSATFTCRAAGSNAINALTSPTATSDPTGLTISSVSVSENYKILATYAGGADGESFDAVFSFTLDSVTRIARQTVNVRKR